MVIPSPDSLPNSPKSGEKLGFLDETSETELAGAEQNPAIH
jgi:hypothetical protein